LKKTYGMVIFLQGGIMNLKHLTDKVLIEDTKILISKEREVLVQLLHHLREIDSRKLYSDLGFSSLFAYMTKGLGYSESSAVRRITAARLLKSHPEIETKIEQGSLNLTNLNQAAFAFKDKSIDQKDLLLKIENKSSDETKKEIFKELGKLPDSKESIKVNSENTYQLKITIDEETNELIKELKALSKDQNITAILKDALKTQIELKKKKKFALTSRITAAATVTFKRTPTNSLKREVFTRDQDCQKCGTKYFLNFDHVKPYSLNGKTTAENLRLLCTNCNQRARIKMKLLKLASSKEH
jgi:hypothetical protein